MWVLGGEPAGHRGLASRNPLEKKRGFLSCKVSELTAQASSCPHSRGPHHLPAPGLGHLGVKFRRPFLVTI